MNSAGGIDVGRGVGARGVAAVCVVVVELSWGAAVGTARAVRGSRRDGVGGAEWYVTSLGGVVVGAGGASVSGVVACGSEGAVGTAGLPVVG